MKLLVEEILHQLICSFFSLFAGFYTSQVVQGFFHQQYFKKDKNIQKACAYVYYYSFIFAHFYALKAPKSNPSVLQQRGHRPSAEGLVGDLAYSGRPKPGDRSGMSLGFVERQIGWKPGSWDPTPTSIGGSCLLQSLFGKKRDRQKKGENHGVCSDYRMIGWAPPAGGVEARRGWLRVHGIFQYI